MDCLFQAFHRFIIIALGIIVITACSQQSSDKSASVEKEYAVSFLPVSQDDRPERINNDPISINGILPAAVWSTATSIWNASLPTNVNNEIYGPELMLAEAGDHFVWMQQNSVLDSSSLGFVNQSSLVFSKEPGQAAWQLDLPFANEFSEGTADITIKSNQLTGGAYAIWTRDGSLYMAQKGADEVWSPEILIWQRNAGMSKLLLMDLFVDANGDAWVLWINGDDVNMSHYVQAAGAGLQEPQITIVSSALAFAEPLMTSKGTIALSWVSLPEDPLLPNLLELIRFEPATGWSAVYTAPPLSTANPMSSHLNMIVYIDESLVVMSQDAFGRIFAIQYDPALLWSAWENVDYNIGRDDIIAHSAKLASNFSGSVMAIWAEDSSFISGRNSTQIFASVFDPVGNASGEHWPLPELVGNGKIAIDPNAIDQVNFKTFPLIEMLSDGRAVAIWLDDDRLFSSLYANYYLPGTGWGEVVDQVVSYERYTDGLVRSADLAVTPAGNVFISWQQLLRTEFSKEYQFWVSDTLL